MLRFRMRAERNGRMEKVRRVEVKQVDRLTRYRRSQQRILRISMHVVAMRGVVGKRELRARMLE